MTAAAATGGAVSMAEARERRRRRAAVAQRLAAGPVEPAGDVDWDTLDAAPGWLALPEAQLATVMRQVGAIVCAPQMRLWIDGARLAAAREALGEAFLRALAAQRDLPALPRELAPQVSIDTAQDVVRGLQAAGTAVLLATLRSFALRRAASAVLGDITPAPMAAELALSLIQRAHTLARHSAAAPAGAKS
jgi:hypothetical protein